MRRLTLEDVAPEVGPEAAALLPWIVGLSPMAALLERLAGMSRIVEQAEHERARLPEHVRRLQGPLMPEPIMRDLRAILEESRSRVVLLAAAASLAAAVHEKAVEELGQGEWPDHLIPGPEVEPVEETAESVEGSAVEVVAQVEPEVPTATTEPTPARRGRLRMAQTQQATP